jgi:uncharacterized protein (TIGR00369 family)
MAQADESAQNRRLGPLEEINRQVRENRIDDYRTPNRALGMRPAAFEKGISRWTWTGQPESVLNQFGLIQGGYVAVLIDELFSTAIASMLDDGEWAVTAETKISYMRALRPGSIDGIGKVIRRTRSIAFLEATISTSDTAEPAVVASSTWSISAARK